MSKNDRTVRGRAPNAGRNLHEQSTKILVRPGTKAAETTPVGRPHRASTREVADALKAFRASDAVKKWRASTTSTVRKDKPRR